MNRLIKKKIISFLFFIFLIQSNANSFEIKASTVILQDFLSGEILYEKEPDRSIYPASMTKIMTSIIAFDLINNGELSLDDKFLISEKAWRLSKPANSSMFIMLNDEISVENLLRGIIVVSGNDACVALAEGIAGTEEAFAELMTAKAIEIGMTNTNFTNSSGLNDPDNYSTVRDILIMSNYLIKNYPNYYEYFHELEFTWDRTGGDPITQPNTNTLLKKNRFVDGIKTGYLAVEKYSLASSLFKNERRLIAVGSGFKTKASRSKQSNRLLNYGLTHFDTIQIAKKNEVIIEIDTWLGKNKTIGGYVKENIYKTIKKAKKKNLKVVAEYNGPIEAPIKKEQKIGILKTYYNENFISEHNIYASADIKKVNLISRIIKSVNYLIWGDV
jgi:D-alanyl-D-alanine carboxypeptidase (penicillin-binding protein 5/6)